MVDCFAGQNIKSEHFTLERSKVLIQKAQKAAQGVLEMHENDLNGSIGYRNSPITITEEQLLQNIRTKQRENELLESANIGRPQGIKNGYNLTILISKQKSVGIPKLIIIGGQEGSFKVNLQKVALKELSNNALVLSKEKLRSYHPNYAEIQAQYPDMLQHFTDNLAKILLLNLENQAIEKRINVVLETSLGNPATVIEKINKYKSHQYPIIDKRKRQFY